MSGIRPKTSVDSLATRDLERAIGLIRAELAERLTTLRGQGKLLEAQRLESRTNFDVEMMLEVGTCAGIENYSRHLSGRQSGERPACLFDFFPEDFLVVVDESHVSLPQIGGMFNGDRARKLTLVDYGFRLPSALDNRPLMFDEFLKLTPRALFVSATPGDLELQLSEGVVVEQVRYLGNQPCPFPSSLMVGFTSRAIDPTLHLDMDEIVEAVWVSRTELREMVRAGRFGLSPTVSIARRIIEHWYGGSIDQQGD